MKKIVALTLFTVLAVAPGHAADAKGAGSQTITRAGTHQSAKAPERNFTGNVTVQRIFNANEHAQFTAANVTFEPGARSFWHSHIGGQHLVVLSGVGRTGTVDGRMEEFRAGDELWCPPGVKHWHGAAPDSAMTHMAITIVKDGKNTEWMEEVTNEQYNGK